MFYYFNEQQIRKAIVAFGSLFSNIAVQRRQEDGRQVAPPFVVPIRYAPGGRDYIVNEYLNEEQTASRDSVQMSFWLSGISLNNTLQKKGSNNYQFRDPSSAGDQAFVYPEGRSINLEFELVITAENASDAFTVFEQIVPFFKNRIPIEIVGDPFPCNFVSSLFLEGVQYEDNFEAEVEERRVVLITLSFVMNFMVFAGYDMNPEDVADDDFPDRYDISGSKPSWVPIINKIIVDFHENEVSFDAGAPGQERLVVKALPEGVLDPDLSTGTGVSVDTDPEDNPDGTPKA